MRILLLMAVLVVSAHAFFKKDKHDDYHRDRDYDHGGYDSGEYNRDFGRNGGSRRSGRFRDSRNSGDVGFGLFGRSRSGGFGGFGGGDGGRGREGFSLFGSGRSGGFGDSSRGGGGFGFGGGSRGRGRGASAGFFEDRDEFANRARLADEEREQSLYRDGLRFGDRDAAEIEGEKGLRFAGNDDLRLRKSFDEQDYLDFENEEIDREQSATELLYKADHAKDSGSKTSFSSGKKTGSDFQVETDVDQHLEDFSSKKARAQKELVLETEKEDNEARESILDAAEETEALSHQSGGVTD